MYFFAFNFKLFIDHFEKKNINMFPPKLPKHVLFYNYLTQGTVSGIFITNLWFQITDFRNPFKIYGSVKKRVPDTLQNVRFLWVPEPVPRTYSSPYLNQTVDNFHALKDDL
jgi:hypothetical protein